MAMTSKSNDCARMKNCLLMTALSVVAFHQALLAEAIDPTAIVESRLKSIGRSPSVTYRTNDNYVFCTAHCADVNERNAVYDGFRNIPKYSLTATKEPPTVCVVVLLDPAAYQSNQQAQKLAAHVGNSETAITGKVLQKTKDGLLVAAADGHTLLVIDGPNLIDDDPISVTGYAIGTYEFSLPNGTPKTVRKYTCDRTAAIDYWAPLATAEATAEARRRAETSMAPSANAPAGETRAQH
jgi:hypothetical protein